MDALDPIAAKPGLLSPVLMESCKLDVNGSRLDGAPNAPGNPNRSEDLMLSVLCALPHGQERLQMLHMWSLAGAIDLEQLLFLREIAANGGDV